MMKHLLLTCLAGALLAQFTWAEDNKIPRNPSPKGAKVEILMREMARLYAAQFEWFLA